jgi:hypothetical protein
MTSTPTDEQIAEAAKKLGIPEVCIRARLKLGWRVERALTVPPTRREGYVRRAFLWMDRTGVLQKVKAEQESKENARKAD